MSETKPPTPGEVAQAREWVAVRERMGASMPYIRVLLAALDAAEARATAAEKERDSVTRACENARRDYDAVRAERDSARSWSVTAERERDALKAKLDGAFVVADDEVTRTAVARACFEFDRCDTWIERTDSDTETYMEQADSVVSALREAGK